MPVAGPRGRGVDIPRALPCEAVARLLIIVAVQVFNATPNGGLLSICSLERVITSCLHCHTRRPEAAKLCWQPPICLEHAVSRPRLQAETQPLCLVPRPLRAPASQPTEHRPRGPEALLGGGRPALPGPDTACAWVATSRLISSLTGFC